MTTEALNVEHAAHVVEEIAALVESTPFERGPDGATWLKWRRSPVPGSLFPMNVEPWEHGAFAVSAPSSEWGEVEGGRRRRNGGTVVTQVDVRWLYGLRPESAVEDYARAVGEIERRLVGRLVEGSAQRAMRTTVLSVDRLEDPGLVTEGDLPGLWLIGIIRLRVDHRYLY